MEHSKVKSIGRSRRTHVLDATVHIYIVYIEVANVFESPYMCLVSVERGGESIGQAGVSSKVCCGENDECASKCTPLSPTVDKCVLSRMTGCPVAITVHIHLVKNTNCWPAFVLTSVHTK